MWVSFRSDDSIGENGFIAQYHSVLPEQSKHNLYIFLHKLQNYVAAIIYNVNWYVCSISSVK